MDERDEEATVHALDRAGLQILNRDECLRLLATATIGRIGVSVRALPMIVPVHFVVDADRILISIHAGTTLDAATRDTVVAFEVDGCGNGRDADWSVLVTGIARHLGREEQQGCAGVLGLPRWSPEYPDRIVAISTDRVSGRRGVGAGRRDVPQR